jgi:DNA-binding MarR family transcriptional regulator
MNDASDPDLSIVADEPVSLGPLPDLLGYALRRAQLVVFADFIERFAAEDIRPTQYSVLQVLKHNPGLRQTQVSAALGIRRTNFVPLLDGLEQRGLAERRRVEGDRRSFALYLTPQGDALLKRLDRMVREHEKMFVRRIGPDGKQTMLDLLRKLTDPARG